MNDINEYPLMVVDRLEDLTPEQRGWRLERGLQLARNQALAQQMLRRITDDRIAIGNALKSYKRYRKPYE